MKKTIEIPESKSDIKLNQYLKLEQFFNDEEQLSIKIMEVIYGISYNELRNMNPLDYKDLITAVFEVLKQKSQFKQRIFIDGVEYGFIPKLDDMTTGELIDLDLYSKNKDWHSLLSILYRPITHINKDKYLVKSYSGATPELFKDISLEVFEGCMGFFLTLFEQLGEITLKSLEKMMMKMNKKEMTMEQKQAVQTLEQKMNLIRSGTGIFNFYGL